MRATFQMRSSSNRPLKQLLFVGLQPISTDDPVASIVTPVPDVVIFGRPLTYVIRLVPFQTIATWTH